MKSYYMRSHHHACINTYIHINIFPPRPPGSNPRTSYGNKSKRSYKRRKFMSGAWHTHRSEDGARVLNGLQGAQLPEDVFARGPSVCRRPTVQRVEDEHVPLQR